MLRCPLGPQHDESSKKPAGLAGFWGYDSRSARIARAAAS